MSKVTTFHQKYRTCVSLISQNEAEKQKPSPSWPSKTAASTKNQQNQKSNQTEFSFRCGTEFGIARRSLSRFDWTRSLARERKEAARYPSVCHGCDHFEEAGRLRGCLRARQGQGEPETHGEILSAATTIGSTDRWLARFDWK